MSRINLKTFCRHTLSLIFAALLLLSASVFAQNPPATINPPPEPVITVTGEPSTESAPEAPAVEVYVYSDDVFHNKEENAKAKALQSLKNRYDSFLDKFKRKTQKLKGMRIESSGEPRFYFASEVRYSPIPFNTLYKFNILPREGLVLRPSPSSFGNEGLKIPSADIVYHYMAEGLWKIFAEETELAGIAKEAEWCGGATSSRPVRFKNTSKDFDLIDNVILVMIEQSEYASYRLRVTPEKFKEAVVLQGEKATVEISFNYSEKASTKTGIRSAIRKSLEATGTKLSAFGFKLKARLKNQKALSLEPKGPPDVVISHTITDKRIYFRGAPELLTTPPRLPMGEYVVISSPIPEDISSKIIQPANAVPPSVTYNVGFSQKIAVTVAPEDLDNLKKALDWLMPGYLPGIEASIKPNVKITSENDAKDKPQNTFDEIEILSPISGTVYGAVYVQQNEGTGNRNPSQNGSPAKVFCIKTKTVEYSNDGSVFQ